MRDDDTAREYPLVMTNGRVPFYHHSTLRNAAAMRELYPVPEIWDAQEMKEFVLAMMEGARLEGAEKNE